MKCHDRTRRAGIRWWWGLTRWITHPFLQTTTLWMNSSWFANNFLYYVVPTFCFKVIYIPCLWINCVHYIYILFFATILRSCANYKYWVLKSFLKLILKNNNSSIPRNCLCFFTGMDVPFNCPLTQNGKVILSQLI